MADSCRLQEGEVVNLLVTIDRKYVEPLAVMIKSYHETNAGVPTDLYVAHSVLTDSDLRRIEAAAEGTDVRVHGICLENSCFKDTPVIERLPEESFFRLIAFDFLPESVHRVLYLDPDILIRKSLLPLYTLDLEGNHLAAASHMLGARNRFNLDRINLSENDKYINSGIMLMDLDAIRRDFTIQDILDCLDENLQLLWLGDQDLINILFGKSTLLIDEKIWNMDERTLKFNRKTFTLDDVREKTAIIHYNGKHKPWLKGYKGKLDVFYPEVKDKGPEPKGRVKEQLKAIRSIIKLTKTQKIYVAGIILALICCAVCWAVFGKKLFEIIEKPEVFRSWLDRFGAFDEIVFILVRAAQTVVKFIPAEPLEIGSGYAWGAVLGTLYCVVGNLLGTLVIWALTRRLGKSFANMLMPSKNSKTLLLFRGTDKIYVLLFFLYLIPGSPKDGFTYLVGFLDVKLVPFLAITFVARIPSVLSSALCGSTLAEKQYLISGAIFLATVVLAVVGGILYKAYSNKKLRENGTTKPRGEEEISTMQKNVKKDYSERILTIPNVLSLVRILMIPAIVWLYLVEESALWTAVILTVSGLTDVVDGYIARHFGMVSDFGKAFDPVADKLTQFSMLACLVVKSPLIAIPLTILIVKEVCTGLLGIAAIRKSGEVKSAVWHGKLTTCVIYLLIIIHILWINIPDVVSDLCIVACSAMMLLSFTLYSVKHIKTIRKSEGK